MILRTDEPVIVRTPGADLAGAPDQIAHLHSIDLDDRGLFLTFATGRPGAPSWGTLTLDSEHLESNDIIVHDDEEILVLTFR